MTISLDRRNALKLAAGACLGCFGRASAAEPTRAALARASMLAPPPASMSGTACLQQRNAANAQRSQLGLRHLDQAGPGRGNLHD